MNTEVKVLEEKLRNAKPVEIQVPPAFIAEVLVQKLIMTANPNVEAMTKIAYTAVEGLSRAGMQDALSEIFMTAIDYK